jgi:hypothetical protein
MSNYADIFVGGVAIVLGLVTLTSAVTPDHAVYQLPKIRWLAAQVGPSGARGVLVGLGVLLVTLGFLIMLGWKWTWESDREQGRVPTRTGRSA